MDTKTNGGASGAAPDGYCLELNPWYMLSYYMRHNNDVYKILFAPGGAGKLEKEHPRFVALYKSALYRTIPDDPPVIADALLLYTAQHDTKIPHLLPLEFDWAAVTLLYNEEITYQQLPYNTAELVHLLLKTYVKASYPIFMARYYMLWRLAKRSDDTEALEALKENPATTIMRTLYEILVPSTDEEKLFTYWLQTA